MPMTPPMFQATLKSISTSYLDKCDDSTIDNIITQAKQIINYVEVGDDGSANKTI